MFNRREFLKTAGIMGLASLAPGSIWTTEAKAALLDNVNYVQPAVMPQIIHIFLYGGPSELAGNLTNIDLIRANSQNPYPSSIDPNNGNNDITANHFWGNAGGTIMEDLLAAGKMSLYRTNHRIKDNNRAHGRSINQNQSGNLDTSHAGIPIDPDTGAAVAYPNNSFGERLRAAVSLAVGNPDTQFMSLGSQGLGGWDDHSGALGDYPDRMQGLMEALRAAARHLELSGADNVVINVFGDFGRNVNLNNSQGWDHGNNQNLFSIGGAGIAGRALGKLAGRTQRIGTPFQNRQFTAPTDDSYQFEPFAIASTLFKYFGVQNPEVLTGEPAIDESANVPNELV